MEISYKYGSACNVCPKITQISSFNHDHSIFLISKQKKKYIQFLNVVCTNRKKFLNNDGFPNKIVEISLLKERNEMVYKHCKNPILNVSRQPKS